MFAFLRRLTPVAILFCGHILAADLQQQPAAIVRAPAAGGTWTVIAADLSVVQPQLLDVGGVSDSILVAPAGRYRVFWVGSGQSLTTLVNVGGSDVVPPGPGPQPPVPVDPPKPSQIAFAIVVCEAQEPAEDVDIGDIRNSGAAGEIAKWAAANNVYWRVIDDDIQGPDKKPPAKLIPFLREAEGKKLPWLIIAGKADGDGDATVIKSVQCPKNAAAVLEILRGAK